VKGAEEIVNKLLEGNQQPKGWMDADGKLHKTDDHTDWGARFLDRLGGAWQKNPLDVIGDVGENMLKRKFLRVVPVRETQPGIHVIGRAPKFEWLTSGQRRALQELANERGEVVYYNDKPVIAL
jgi:hypothetical protein